MSSRITRTFALLLALALVCLSRASPVSAATYSADAIKAAFLYRFASYVEWPADAMTEGEFVIGVVGGDAVAAHLEKLLPGLAVGNRPARVRRVTRAEDLRGVQILYVGPQGLARTRAVRDAALQSPILLVIDSGKGFEANAVINFVEINRNVRFEISLESADRRKLKIDSALLSVAARVEART